MNPTAPNRLPLEELAANASRFHGSLDAAAFSSRVAQALDVPTVRGRVEYALGFPALPVGAVVVTGELDASLEARCQRRLEPFELALDVPVRLVVAADTAVTEAPAGWEIGAPEMRPRLVDFIEQELLLALPISPRHPPGDCPAGAGQGTERALPQPFVPLDRVLREKGD